MDKNKTKSYQPISLPFKKKISDKSMILKSEDFLLKMKSRHTIRDFSDRLVPYSIIENCIKVACSAPSGANLQPWHFVVISDPNIKSKIRIAAENEEKKSETKDNTSRCISLVDAW